MTDLLFGAGEALRVLLICAAIFLLPGYAILVLLPGRLGLDRVEALCVAAGVSLALIPLTVYAATLLGVRLGPLSVAILLGLSSVALLVDLRRRTPSLQTPLIYAGLGIVFAFVLIGRLWSVRDLDFPLWTDSYAHTLIVQLFVEQGRIPDTYRPYAPLDAFTYHFGFHSVAAWVTWLTGLETPRAVVIAGQWVNALVVPAAYLLTQRLFQDRRAGLAAAALAGLFTHTPLQYVNWGRYTQLDGQTVLPIAFFLFAGLVMHPTDRRPARVGLAGLVFAGFYLTHYRVFLYAAILCAAYLVVQLIWSRWANLRPILIACVALAALVLLLTAPWNVRLLGGFGGEMAREVVGGYAETRHGDYFDFNVRGLVEYGAPLYLLALAGAGLAWGLVTRVRGAWTLALWLLGLFAAANLHRIGITPLFSNTTVIIALYLPIAAAAGWFVVMVADVVTRHLPRNLPVWTSDPVFAPASAAGDAGAAMPVAPPHRTPWAWAGLLALSVAAAATLPAQTAIVAHDNAFVRDADLAAYAWVRAETPEDALFFVATTFWTPFVAHGLDGGYYLPLMTGRQTIMPPQKYASDAPPAQTEAVNQLLRELHAAAGPLALHAVLNAHGITYVYIGARPTYLNPHEFTAHPTAYDLRYAADGVYIFAVLPGGG